jgi:hypothetical protein
MEVGRAKASLRPDVCPVPPAERATRLVCVADQRQAYGLPCNPRYRNESRNRPLDFASGEKTFEGSDLDLGRWMIRARPFGWAE